MVITRVPGGTHGSEFGMYLTTILANIFVTPKGPQFKLNQTVFEVFGGSQSCQNIIYRAPYSYHGEYIQCISLAKPLYI